MLTLRRSAMRRNEPPAFAIWMLEHLAPGARDPAFDQVLQISSIPGARRHGTGARYSRHAPPHGSIGCDAMRCFWGFAFFWSILVPAWTALLDRTENNTQVLGRTWQMDWPFSSFGTFGIWLASSFLFLWTGLLVYLVVQTGLRWNSNLKGILRSFMLRVPLFFPLYFATFVILNLWSYPGPEVDRSTISPLGGIIDVRFWANAIRIPYFLTLLWAVWKVAPGADRLSPDSVVGFPDASTDLSGLS